MKALLHLAVHSAWNRRSTLLLVVLSIALATLLLLGLERMRTDVRESFRSRSAAPIWWSEHAPARSS